MKVTQLVALTPLLLTACGGSAQATLKLMDAPPAGVTAVHVTVASMQVHVDAADSKRDGDPADSTIDDDARWSSLSVGRTIDLVQHQGETAAEVLGQLDLPEGKVTQLRLRLDTSRPERNTATLADGTVCALDVTRVDTKGIKLNHVFKAFQTRPGEKHEVFVDFRLDESLTASGACYVLSPKLQLTHVKTDGADQGL
jgi:hypothetical protein